MKVWPSPRPQGQQGAGVRRGRRDLKKQKTTPQEPWNLRSLTEREIGNQKSESRWRDSRTRARFRS